MFFKKKVKNTTYFVFNYGCSTPAECVSLSVENELINAEWYDKEGTHYLYRDIPATQEFWNTLFDTVKEKGVLEWKAHKLFNRFASEISLSVFNGEGLFPNGERFEANNMHGLPDGFEDAVAALTKVFYTFSDKN